MARSSESQPSYFIHPMTPAERDAYFAKTERSAAEFRRQGKPLLAAMAVAFREVIADGIYTNGERVT